MLNVKRNSCHQHYMFSVENKIHFAVVEFVNFYLFSADNKRCYTFK